MTSTTVGLQRLLQAVGLTPVHASGLFCVPGRKSRPNETNARAPGRRRVGDCLCRVVTLAAMTSLVACQSKGESVAQKKLAELNISTAEAKRILAELSTKRAEHQAPQVKPASAAPRSEPPGGAPGVIDAEIASGEWVVDPLEDVGPAAPSSANPLGVFLVNGGNELFLAKLGPLPNPISAQASSIGVVPDSKGPFALGRGPAFTPRYAYWVTSHFLLRRPTSAPYGPLEIIAEDARVGTRPATVVIGDEAAVAYIALPKIKDGPLRARLWREKQAPKTAVDLTDAGNSTLSVSLVARHDDALALSLEARMGVTALHVRSFDVGSGVLGADEVPWIGGTAQPLTEIRSLGKTNSFWAFLAMEQDSSHFGLAVLSSSEGASTLRESWVTFPNGLDPAPVAATTACGRDVVLFARPSEATPKAPQELVLAQLVGGTLTHDLVLSRARAYYDLSMAPLIGGVLVSFVADQRTWARTLRCAAPKPSKR